MLRSPLRFPDMDTLSFQLQMERARRAIQACQDLDELKEVALALTKLCESQRGTLMAWINMQGKWPGETG